MDVHLDARLLQDISLPLMLLVATVTDFRRRRVPNLLTFGFMGLGLLVGLLGGSLGSAALGIGAAFVPGFLLFALGGTIRAGDAKLLMALGAFLGPVHVLRVLLFTMVINVPVALVQLIMAGRLRTLPAVIIGGLKRDTQSPPPLTAPFALVIALGYLVARYTPWLGGHP